MNRHERAGKKETRKDVPGVMDALNKAERSRMERIKKREQKNITSVAGAGTVCKG